MKMKRNADKSPWLGTGLVLLALLAGYVPQPLHAQKHAQQTYTVRGEILSLVDGLPLANITVYLKDTEFTAVSDTGGVFAIKGVPAGVYDVVAKYPDFDATILKNVEVPPRSRKDFVFNLEPTNGASSLPYLDRPAPDSLGYVQGEVSVAIDTFKTGFENGRLLLRAAVAGDITMGYLYPQEWKLLPVKEQRFRFKFYLPKGKRYRLYLIWRERREAFTVDRIIDVIREPGRPNTAAIFNLQALGSVSGIRYRVGSAVVAKF